MARKKIILASSSPRRIELLRNLGIPFEAIKPKAEEKIFNTPEKTVLMNAKAKIYSILDRVKANALIVSADTVVVVDGEILGKPQNKDNAFKFLKMLSGKTHEVYTSIVIYDIEKKIWDYVIVRSLVKFMELSDAEILDYITTDEPLDKAGGYGIQDLAGLFVEEIHGDFFAIVGFPLNAFYKLLKRHGMNLLRLTRSSNNASNNTASRFT